MSNSQQQAEQALRLALEAINQAKQCSSAQEAEQARQQLQQADHDLQQALAVAIPQQEQQLIQAQREITEVQHSLNSSFQG